MSGPQPETLWDFDDPAGSEERFDALLARARSREMPILAKALTQVARAEGLQRRFEDADRTLDEAEAALRPDDARARVRLDLERGRVANTAARSSGPSQRSSRRSATTTLTSRKRSPPAGGPSRHLTTAEVDARLCVVSELPCVDSTQGRRPSVTVGWSWPGT